MNNFGIGKCWCGIAFSRVRRKQRHCSAAHRNQKAKERFRCKVKRSLSIKQLVNALLQDVTSEEWNDETIAFVFVDRKKLIALAKAVGKWKALNESKTWTG